MARLRVLLIGTFEQSDVEKWTQCDVVGLYDPYFVTSQEQSPVKVLKAPCFDLSFIDAVVFVTPNYEKLVVPLVCSALQSGLPVLVQKLRISCFGDMDPIRSLKSNIRENLYIGEQYRYLPGALALRQGVSEGLIGAVEYASWRCVLDMKARSSWMDSYHHLILEDLTYHHMGSLMAVMWQPLRGTVYARSWCPTWMSDKGYCSLNLNSDLFSLNYDVRWGAPASETSFFGELILEGAKGALWTDGEQARFNGRDGSTKALTTPTSVYSGWAGIVNHFCDHLEGKDKTAAGSLFTFDSFDTVLKILYGGVSSTEGNKLITL